MTTTPLTPQDQAINHSPVQQVWEVWKYEDVVHGSVIDWIPPWKAKQRYQWCYEFKGKTAHYTLLTDDASIERSEALDWAVHHFNGRMRTYSIDFAYWNDYGKQK